MTVDISKIKPGDEVTMRGIVVHTDREDVRSPVQVRFDNGQSTWPSADSIVSHTPKAFQPGDRVRVRGGSGFGNIVAIDGEEAWVRWSDGSSGVWPVTTMERADD